MSKKISACCNGKAKIMYFKDKRDMENNIKNMSNELNKSFRKKQNEWNNIQLPSLNSFRKFSNI